MYPLKFKPIYKERLWGGTHIHEVFGREISGNNIGESWDLSSHPHGVSVVDNGYLAGKNLNELVAEYKEQLIGTKFDNENEFPLLVKILDANEHLSIQVHPDDASADQSAGERGKIEAWYVIHAEENAQIVYGLKSDITKDKFAQAIEQHTIRDTVRMLSVKPGDMIFVPAGVVHALLKGVMVYEVQQTSDTTYRVYDFDRIGDDGKYRELHTDKAIQVINFTEQPSPIFTDQPIDCPYFSMEKIIVTEKMDAITNGGFIIYCVIAGTGEIRYKEYIECLHPGDTVLIPACVDSFTVTGDLELLKTI